MRQKTELRITWSKAFGEIYCHHASLHIPFQNNSLLPPENVLIGVTVRTNVIENGNVVGKTDKKIYNFLPCIISNSFLIVPLNSSSIIDGISIDTWTSLKNGERGKHKEFPVCMSYQIGEENTVVLPFNYEHGETPYLISEKKFKNLTNGEKIEVPFIFN